MKDILLARGYARAARVALADAQKHTRIAAAMCDMTAVQVPEAITHRNAAAVRLNDARTFLDAAKECLK